MSNDAALAFSAFLERALYDPERGFYETGGRAGRRGDFVTSPEVGPLFGACLARALDAWWDGLHRPDPFLVDEHGAGPGTLARTVVVAAPACADALRWTLVERSVAQRALHPEHLTHVGGLGADGGSADPRWASGPGPLVASVAAPPDRSAHVIVANELLDDLPFDLLERTAAGWHEVRVAGAGGAEPTEALVPAAASDAAWADVTVPGAPLGARVPVQRQAGEWVAAALEGLVPGGRMVLFDYASTTADLASRDPREWIRTYAGQARGGAPLAAPGTQDVTTEVCVDQLSAAARPPDLDRDQASALRAWGLDHLVEEGRQLWVDAAGAPDLGALRVRSRVAEAKALTDPAGLGAFAALEWQA